MGLLALMIAVSMSSDDAEASMYDVDLVYTDPSNIKTAKGIQPIHFNYTLIHTGDVLSEEVNLDISGVPSGWNVFISVSTRAGIVVGTYPGTLEFVLSRGERAPMTIFVTPKPMPPGTYWMQAEAFPEKDPNMGETHRFAVRFPTIVNAELAVVEPWGGYVEVDPSAEVNVTLDLYHMGNARDSFLLEIANPMSEEGWKVEVLGGLEANGSTPVLDPDPSRESPHRISLRVTVPGGTQGNVTATFVITATSDSRPSAPPGEASVEVRTRTVHRVTIELSTTEVSILPGANTTVTALIRNLGNVDEICVVEKRWSGAEPDHIQAELGVRDVTIGSWSDMTMAIEISAGPKAATADHSIELSVSSPDECFEVQVQVLVVHIIQVHRVHLVALSPTLSDIPGGVLDFAVRVDNMGNGLDVFVIELADVPTGWEHQVIPVEVTLVRGESVVVRVRVILSGEFDKAPIGEHPISVTARSTRGDAVDSVELEAIVLQVFRIEWLKDGEPVTSPDQPVAPEAAFRTPAVNPMATDTMGWNMTLANLGNGPDHVSVRATASHEALEVQVEPAEVQVDASGLEGVSVTVGLPSWVPPGSYNINIKAVSEGGGDFNRTVPLVLEVGTLDVALPPCPTYVDPEMGEVVESRLKLVHDLDPELCLVVENNGTLPIPGLVLTLHVTVVYIDGFSLGAPYLNISVPAIDVGAHHTVRLTPFSDDVAPLWDISFKGGRTYVLRFLALLRNQVDDGNDECRVTVIVNTPPIINVTSGPHSAPVGGDLEITGEVMDDFDNVDLVQVRIDGGDWVNATLDEGGTRWRYHITSIDLELGEHLLEAKAFDGLSESDVASTSFEVTKKRVTPSPGPSYPWLMLAMLLVIITAVILVLVVRRKHG